MTERLYAWLHPLIDAISLRQIPLDYRWRLLLFQPISFLVYAIGAIPMALPNKRVKTYRIPVRNGRTRRALIFSPDRPAQASAQRQLRTLHLDIHGGAFIGGQPEAGWRFCKHVSDSLDTIVVSTSYRFAPRWGFPALHDDVDDVLDWLLEHAEKEFGADVSRLTIGGSSAGGNLALSTCMRKRVRERVNGVVTFYAAIDLSRHPWEKPKGADFPDKDPLAFMMPLYDAYAGPARVAGHTDNERLSPCKANFNKVPDRVLMVVPLIDILPDEHFRFAERINAECERRGLPKKVELMVMAKCFHGWLELPSAVIPKGSREKVFDRCVDFIKEVNRKAEVAG